MSGDIAEDLYTRRRHLILNLLKQSLDSLFLINFMKDHERKSRLRDKAARIIEEAKQVHSILTPRRHHIAARRSRDPGCAVRLHGVCYFITLSLPHIRPPGTPRADFHDQSSQKSTVNKKAKAMVRSRSRCWRSGGEAKTLNSRRGVFESRRMMPGRCRWQWRKRDSLS